MVRLAHRGGRRQRLGDAFERTRVPSIEDPQGGPRDGDASSGANTSLAMPLRTRGALARRSASSAPAIQRASVMKRTGRSSERGGDRARIAGRVEAVLERLDEPRVAGGVELEQ